MNDNDTPPGGRRELRSAVAMDAKCRELRHRHQATAEDRDKGNAAAAEVRQRRRNGPHKPPQTYRHMRAHERALHRAFWRSLDFVTHGRRHLNDRGTTFYTETARIVRERNQYVAHLVYLSGDGYSDPRRSPYYIEQ